MKLDHIFDNEIEFGTSIMDIEVPDKLRQKIPTGLSYIDDVLGGQGFTPSSVTLFCGTPGAGKTTLALIIANALAKNDVTSLYNTAEESLYQLKLCSDRLHINNNVLVGSHIQPQTIIERCEHIRNLPENQDENGNPKDFALIIDSLQTLNDGKYGVNVTNSKTPERCLAEIVDWCKQTHSIAVVIGHVAKNGDFAGTNTLKHMADAMLQMAIEVKDDELYGCRTIQCSKNRFGSAGTKIWLQPTSTGFIEMARDGIGMEMIRI